MIDNVFMDDEPYKLFLEGKHAHVPLMSGNTYDEFPSSIFAGSKEEFEAKAREIFGSKTEKFLSFPEAQKNNGNQYATLRAIECAVKAAFAHNDKPGYYYCFEPDIPGDDNPGTFHSVDLWFFFDNLDKCWRPMTGRHFDIARQMSTYFVNFIKNGDPNGNDVDGTALPLWKPFTPASKNEMHFTRDGAKTAVQEALIFPTGNTFLTVSLMYSTTEYMFTVHTTSSTATHSVLEIMLHGQHLLMISATGLMKASSSRELTIPIMQITEVAFMRLT